MKIGSQTLLKHRIVYITYYPQNPFTQYDFSKTSHMNMTYIVSGGALNSTHSLHALRRTYKKVKYLLNSTVDPYT